MGTVIDERNGDAYRELGGQRILLQEDKGFYELLDVRGRDATALVRATLGHSAEARGGALYKQALVDALTTAILTSSANVTLQIFRD